MAFQLQDNESEKNKPTKEERQRNVCDHRYHFIHFTKGCQYDYNYTMPKKTRLQKLRNQERTIAHQQAVQTLAPDDVFFSGDPAFKKDLIKSILFALAITGFEIALYFIYYLRLFERR